MNFDRVNKWLMLGANIGVVLGLLILIVEVRQNASLTRVSLETAKNDQLANIELSIASPAVATAWTKSIRAPETMTDADVRMVESHLVAIMLQWDNLFQMENGGLTSRARTQRHIKNSAPYYFGSAYAKNWWKLQELGWENTPMAEVAGPIIDDIDDQFLQQYLDSSRITPAAKAPTQGNESLLIEARRFMESYGEDLRNHDREKIASRYARAGAHMILNGQASFRTFDEIQSRYRSGWSGPARFDWGVLSYKTVGDDAVLVVGHFDWGADGGAVTYTYTGLLKREQGELRIVLEDETDASAEN